MCKGIIITNYPSGCMNCNKNMLDICGIERMSVQPWARKEKTKPRWCPIKPLPEKKTDSIIAYKYPYEKGYNTCIDEILGKE